MSKQAKTVGLVLGGLAVAYFVFLRSSTASAATSPTLFSKLTTAIRPATSASGIAPSTGPAVQARSGRGHF